MPSRQSGGPKSATNQRRHGAIGAGAGVVNWAGTQGFRHERRSNTAFCDGHAQSLKNRFTDNANGAAHVVPGTGFLSADNSLYDLE